MILYLVLAIGFLICLLMILTGVIMRQREKFSHLRSIYTNGDGGLGEHASIAEWQRLAQASLEASRARRKNGAPHV